MAPLRTPGYATDSYAAKTEWTLLCGRPENLK